MRRQTEEQRERRKIYHAAWRLANKEKIVADRQRYNAENRDAIAERGANYRRANSKKVAERMSLYYASNKETLTAYKKRYHLANAKRLGEKSQQWVEANRPRQRATQAKRRATKLQATPTWADLPRIAEVYKLSHQRSTATGITHHVDHIVPLQGKTVCGLHVHHNLQVLTQSENCSKRNSYWPDMP